MNEVVDKNGIKYEGMKKDPRTGSISVKNDTEYKKYVADREMKLKVQQLESQMTDIQRMLSVIMEKLNVS